VFGSFEKILIEEIEKKKNELSYEKWFKIVVKKKV